MESNKKDVPRILLDVGGQHYSTTEETLKKFPDSLLANILSGVVPICDGRYFIDRDGTHFRHILNFLRDPDTFELKTKDKQFLHELRVESRYYGLEDQIFSKSSDVDTSKIPQGKYLWFGMNDCSIESFSSQYSGCPATNVLDPSKSYWLSESGKTTNQWIVFDFKKKVHISKLSLKVDYFECTAKDFKIEVSENDDRETWESVKDCQAECGYDNTGEQTFQDFNAIGRYIRLYFLNNWGPGGGSYILVTLVKFWGAPVDE